MELLALLRESAAGYPCPDCSRALADCRLELVDESEGVYRVRVACAGCGATFFILLEADDQPRAALGGRVPPISGDELLDLHGALGRHEGPLTELLGRS